MTDPASGPQPPNPDRPLSYSERYRGTEWSDAPPPVVAAPSSRGAPIGPILVGVVLLAVAGALGFVAFSGGVGARAPITRVSLSPTAPGQETATDRALERFEALVAEDELPHHVLYEGNVRNRGAHARVAGNADVRGADVSGELTYFKYGRIYTADVVVLDGDVYFREDDVEGGWEVSDSFSPYAPTNILPPLRGAEMESLGRAVRDGDRLHQLRTEQWVGEDIAALAAEFDMKGRVEKSDLRLFVRDDGTPVQALLRAVLRLTGSGSNVKLDIDVTYHFSNVGEPVEIVAPEID